MAYCFTLPCKVRDYECDMQGIVNNSVYQNYLEHARHEFLLARGLNFAELTRQGLHLVLTRVEMDFRSSLRSGDEFWIGLNFEPRGKMRFVFNQDIYRTADNSLVLNALVTGSGVDSQGKLLRPAQLQPLVQLLESRGT